MSGVSKRLQREKAAHAAATAPNLPRALKRVYARQIFSAAWQFCSVALSIGRDTIHLGELFAADGEILVNIKNENIGPYFQALSLACSYGLLVQVGFLIRAPEKTMQFIAAHQKEFNDPAISADRERELLTQILNVEIED